MSEIVGLSAQLIASTQFTAPADIDWGTDAEGGEALIEFAGRACYETWDKPNPRTATNEGYLRHVLEVGHTSLFEHASASIYVRGLSRSCSHELTRHRHFSFSQLSQRFVPDTANRVVAPAYPSNAYGLDATTEPSRRRLTSKSPNAVGAAACSSRRHATASARISESACSVARIPMKCRHER